MGNVVTAALLRPDQAAAAHLHCRLPVPRATLCVASPAVSSAAGCSLSRSAMPVLVLALSLTTVNNCSHKCVRITSDAEVSRNEPRR